ncbi:P-loop NTPase fold protein [Maribacter algicola]|uniref:P-loop NTPase fold protein n=1 Tax=Meishania litoralis TaxID=3434685 RepID=A0ACC7LM32_9FLAO
MSYLLDNELSEDRFGIHTNISKTLNDIITDEKLDLSDGSFTIGLFGKWGSGKSLILRHLFKNFLKKNEDVCYVYIDVWKYVNTSLYRSILFDIEKEIRNSSNLRVSTSFSDGYKYDGQSLTDILDRNITIEEDYDKKQKKWYRKVGDFLLKYWYLLLIFIVIVVLKNISWTEDITWLREILKSFYTIFIFMGGLKIFEDVFKEIGKGFQKETSVRVVSNPPTFSQDQFENIFKDIVNQCVREMDKNGSPSKMVIVFDNIDRCESKVSYQTLTGLRTFMEHKNCVYIIPCDDKEIMNHLYRGKKGLKLDFMDKVFQTYMRIPVLEEFDRDDFIEDLLKESIVPIEKKDFDIVKSILYRGYRGQTPRQIKRFINDYITYYRLSKNIDSKEEFLLKDLRVFTFFIVTKQVFTEAEGLFVQYPDFFRSYQDKAHPLYEELKKVLDRSSSNGSMTVESVERFRLFVNSFGERLNLKKVQEPMNFVFLKKEVRFDIYRLRDKLINQEAIEVTKETPRIVQIILKNFKSKEEKVYLEDSIDYLVVHILEEDKRNDTLLEEIFKIIWEYRNDVPSSYLVGNSELLHSKLDLLQSPKLRTSHIEILPHILSEKHNQKAQKIFDTLLPLLSKSDLNYVLRIKGEFDLESVGEIFPIPYLRKSSIKNLNEIIPMEYIEKVFNESNFNEDEVDISNLVPVFITDSDKMDLKSSKKLTQLLSPKIQQLNGQRRFSPHDKHVVYLLSKILSSDNYSKDFYNQLFLRINYYSGQSFQQEGKDYFLQGLRLLKDEGHQNNLSSWFSSSRYFVNENTFKQFLKSLSKDDIEYLLIRKTKDKFLGLIKQFKLTLPFLSKFDFFLLENYYSYLTSGNISMSFHIIERIDRLNDERLNQLREQLISDILSMDIEETKRYVSKITSFLNSPVRKMEFLVSVIESYLPDIYNNIDLISKNLERLEKLKGDMGSVDKSRLTRITKGWIKETKDIKNITKVKNRFSYVLHPRKPSRKIKKTAADKM